VPLFLRPRAISPSSKTSLHVIQPVRPTCLHASKQYSESLKAALKTWRLENNSPRCPSEDCGYLVLWSSDHTSTSE
jgi:hypothetical protein